MSGKALCDCTLCLPVSPPIQLLAAVFAFPRVLESAAVMSRNSVLAPEDFPSDFLCNLRTPYGDHGQSERLIASHCALSRLGEVASWDQQQNQQCSYYSRPRSTLQPGEPASHGRKNLLTMKAQADGHTGDGKLAISRLIQWLQPG